MPQIAFQVLAKPDPVFLEEQYIDRTAGAIKTFGLPPPDKEAGGDRGGVVITGFAVALDDIPDHQGHDFDHGHQADAASAGNVRIQDGDEPTVFGVGLHHLDHRTRVAGVKGAVDFIDIAHGAAYRQMIVVVFFGGQAEDGELAVREDPQPVRFVGAQQFVEIEKFFLQKKRDCRARDPKTTRASAGDTTWSSPAAMGRHCQ